MTLSLTQASTIVDTALKKGRETNCAPLSVAVLDAGGHLVAFKREDRSGILRFDIAFTSALKRAQLTLGLILEEIGQPGLETIKDQALNERRTRGANVPAAIAEVETALAGLSAVESSLAAERAALWEPVSTAN